MTRSLIALAELSLPVSAAADRADQALESDTIAWDLVEGLTTEIGPRMPGTEQEARARVWAMDWLRANGFANVADEPFDMETWVRGTEMAEVVAPYAQPMAITALSTTASTGPQGIEA